MSGNGTGLPSIQTGELLFYEEISCIRNYNKTNNITFDKVPWNDMNAVISTYTRITGRKYQSQYQVKYMLKLSFIKDDEWETVKQYLIAFKNGEVSFTAPHLCPNANTRNGYRDLNSGRFWKLFNACYDKNPAHTLAGFYKVDGRYRSYDELLGYLSRDVSKLLGRLRAFGIHFSSIQEACDTMLDGRNYTEKQLYKALRCRVKYQRVGIKKSYSTLENVTMKLKWYFDEYCNAIKWSGHHISDFNLTGELKMAEMAIMDTQWLSEFVDFKSFFKAAEACQVEILMLHEGSTPQSFYEFKAKELLTEPTFAVKLLLKDRDELIFNNVIFNTMDVWVYVRDGDEVYTWKELRSAVDDIQIASMMLPEAFGQVMLKIISSIFDEEGPSSTLVVPPTIALPEFRDIMKNCVIPIDYVYIDDEHKMRVEEIRQSITLHQE